MLAFVLGLAYSSLSSIGSLADSLDRSVNLMAKKTAMIERVSKLADALRFSQRGVVLYSAVKTGAVEKSKEEFHAATVATEKLVAELKPYPALRPIFQRIARI